VSEGGLTEASGSGVGGKNLWGREARLVGKERIDLGWRVVIGRRKFSSLNGTGLRCWLGSGGTGWLFGGYYDCAE